jgi:hypothetical protein
LNGLKGIILNNTFENDVSKGGDLMVIDVRELKCKFLHLVEYLNFQKQLGNKVHLFLTLEAIFLEGCFFIDYVN